MKLPRATLRTRTDLSSPTAGREQACVGLTRLTQSSINVKATQRYVTLRAMVCKATLR